MEQDDFQWKNDFNRYQHAQAFLTNYRHCWRWYRYGCHLGQLKLWIFQENSCSV